MSKHLWKFDSGIYPVIPGLSIKLGDYGYWRDSQWCRLGNIEEIPNSPIVFSIKETDLNQEVSETLYVDIVGADKANVAIEDIKAGASLIFHKKNSQLFKGKFSKSIEYASINMEVDPYLRHLMDAGIWKPEYWLAYYVVYSDRFVTMRSNQAGVVASITTDLSVAGVESEAQFMSNFSISKGGVEVVSSFGDERKFAGAKFISLEKKGLLKKDFKVKFNSDGPDEIIWA